MKKGFAFAALAILAAAAGAIVAFLALRKRKEFDKDDIELSDSVFFESDGEDFDEANDDHYSCDCNDYEDEEDKPEDQASDQQ